MNGLSPQAQSIVDAARADDGPTDADYARNRRATMARVGLGLGAIGAGASTATTAGAATVSVSGAGVASAVASGSSAATVLALKAIATLAVIGAAGLGTARLHVTGSARSALASASANVSNPPLPSQAMPRPVPAERAAAPQSAIESEKPAAPLVDHRDAPPRTRVAKPSSTLVEGSLSTLAAETALLGATNEALANSKPERALALLDEYVARFPHGSLEEEHAATRAIALCEANRAVEGRDAAALFFRAHPKSPLTARVRLACEN
jgi:hypothetical protein